LLSGGQEIWGGRGGGGLGGVSKARLICSISKPIYGTKEGSWGNKERRKSKK